MKPISSCLECAMLHECHKSLEPGRELARTTASQCGLLAKGRTTDVLKVLGRDRGISRKKAVRLWRTGHVQWVDATTVMLVGSVRPEKRTYLEMLRG